MLRYEVGRQENAEAFVAEVVREFDTLGEVPGSIGSLLFTRGEDGEALQLLLFDTEEAAKAGEEDVLTRPVPETGAREIVTGRRADTLGGPLWKAWQGHWHVRTDDRSFATS